MLPETACVTGLVSSASDTSVRSSSGVAVEAFFFPWAVISRAIVPCEIVSLFLGVTVTMEWAFRASSETIRFEHDPTTLGVGPVFLTI